MHATCVNSKDNAKWNNSDHIFVIRENTRLKAKMFFYTIDDPYRSTYNVTFADDNLIVVFNVKGRAFFAVLLGKAVAEQFCPGAGSHYCTVFEAVIRHFVEFCKKCDDLFLIWTPVYKDACVWKQDVRSSL